MIKSTFKTVEEWPVAKWLVSKGYRYEGHFWDEALDVAVPIFDSQVTSWGKATGRYREAKLCPAKRGWVVYEMTDEEYRHDAFVPWAEDRCGFRTPGIKIEHRTPRAPR